MRHHFSPPNSESEESSHVDFEPSQEHLSVSAAFDFDDQHLKRISGAPNLRHLDLDYESLALICIESGKLRILEFGSVERLADTDEIELQPLNDLKNLKIWCAPLEEPAFRRAFCSSVLRSLTVVKESVNDDALSGIATRYPRLEDLAIGDCSEVSAAVRDLILYFSIYFAACLIF